jgi:hypothetical protein
VKLSQKGILSEDRPREDVLYSQLNTLCLQVLRRIFLPSYTRNTTLFGELYGKKCFWLSIFGVKLSQKGILAKIALHKHFAIANGSTLWLQVLSRVFLPSYTQNTTLFSELSEKKCCLVRAAMLGLVFTGACLVYYVRSLSSLTPTGKKINCLSDLLKKRKIRGFSLASLAREK